MSQVAIVIDLPNESATTAPAGSFIAAAEEVTQRVRRDFPAEAPTQIGGGFTFSTTTTDSDPGAAVLRLNAADQRAATRIYIDDADAGAKDWAAITARLGAGVTAVKGLVRIQNAAHPENNLVFEVTSVSDASGYNKLVGTVKSYGFLADAGTTPGSPTVVIANSTAVQVTVTPENTTRAAATFESITVADADLSALTAVEIAALESTAATTLTTSKVVNGAAAGAVAVTGISADSLLVSVKSYNLDPTPSITSVAGGLAGALTVVCAATDELKSAVTVDDITHAVTDITATTSITGTNTINTGAVVTTGTRVVVTLHAADSVTASDLTSEFTVTGADAIDNTAGTSSAGKFLVVTWYNPA